MKCKQGDLALIVKSDADNVGKIVRCLKLGVGERPVVCGIEMKQGAWWYIDMELTTNFGHKCDTCLDDSLMPIRPDDTEQRVVELELDTSS